MYCLALIGDVCNSRNLEQHARAAVQQQLKAQLQSLNQVFAQTLRSPFTLTLGDEFQALFADASDLWQAISTLQAELFPIKLRFGLGLGQIVTEINRESALGMDGAAFYRARDAINLLKGEDGLYSVLGLPDTDLIAPTLAFLSGAQNKWKKTRFQVFNAYLSGQTVETTADAVGISKVAVYKNINDGMLASIEQILESITRRMNQEMERGNEY